MTDSNWRGVVVFCVVALQAVAVNLCEVAVGPVCAVAAEAVAKDDSADRIVVAGDVVDTAGKPAAKARVVVQAFPNEIETTSDERGHFEFSSPAVQLRGRSVLVYGSGGEQIGRHEFPYEAEKFTALKPLRIELKPTANVRLHVTDNAGQPVAGAMCGGMADYVVYGDVKTDEQGRAQFRIPADVQLHNVYAIKSELGIDYRAFYDPAKYRTKEPQIKPPLDEPFELKLDGAHTVRVKVVDEQTEEPIANAKTYLWLTKKPGEVDELNLSYYSKQLGVKTDDKGWAVYDWMPYWEEQKSLTFWASHADYGHVRGQYDLDNGFGALTIKLPKLVELSGQVRFPDGRPAAGIPVRATGEGYSFDSFREETRTDAEGRYSFKAWPNLLYLVVAVNSQWGAIKDSFTLLPGQPKNDVDLVLQPATRIHGRITSGEKKRPVPGFNVTSYQYGKSLLEQKKGVELPNPEGSNKSVIPMTFYHAITSDDGEYEFFVGPGSFDVRGPTNTKVQKFKVTDQKELEFNFHSDQPEEGKLKGVVIEAKSGEPAANAKVVGIYRNPLAGRDLDVTADARGEFQVERESHRTVLFARSENRALAGVVEIGPADEQVRIQVRPVARAVGVLIDKQTKQPLAGKEIRYGIDVPIGGDDAPWRTAFGGKAMTDGEGKFVLENLVQGQKYSIDVVRENRGYVEIANITPKDAEEIDLGKREYSKSVPRE